MPFPLSRPLNVVPAAPDARPSASVGDTELDDGKLVAAAYRDHHEVVRAFARRLIGDDAAAEDLVQETFVAFPRALRRASQRSRDCPSRALLLGICANHAKHHVRAGARRRAAMARLAQAGEPPNIEGPESRTARIQLREHLQRALDTLSIDHRVVLILCDVEERTSGEVATILAIPEATVRTRLHHARRNLRSAFDAKDADS